MKRDYFDEYMQIVGQTELCAYTSAEEEARKIEKCTILKDVDVSYSNQIVGYNSEIPQYIY
ncbi:MAG: hypothetical protein K1W10_15375 [Lachnospiraceae bacterium]